MAEKDRLPLKCLRLVLRDDEAPSGLHNVLR